MSCKRHISVKKGTAPQALANARLPGRLSDRQHPHPQHVAARAVQHLNRRLARPETVGQRLAAVQDLVAVARHRDRIQADRH